MRVVVVGAGQAGLVCINNIAKVDDLQVYLIEKNNPSFKSYLLIDWLIDKASDSEFFIYSEDLKNNFESIVTSIMNVNEPLSNNDLLSEYSINGMVQSV